MRVTVEFVLFLIRIVDGVFLNLLRQNRYYSLMIVLVNVCFHCRMVQVFHQDFLRFCGGSLGCMMYLRLLGDVLHRGQNLFFRWSCQNLRRIQQVFRRIVFCRVGFCIYMQIPFCEIFENLSICFLYYGCF